MARLYKDLEQIFEGGKYKLVQITDTCQEGRKHSLNSLEFVAKDEHGKERADYFSHTRRIMR